MKAGPKRAIDDSPLRWRPRSTGSACFAAFSQRFIRVPKGAGALSPLVLRAWHWTQTLSLALPGGRYLEGKEEHPGRRAGPLRTDVWRGGYHGHRRCCRRETSHNRVRDRSPHGGDPQPHSHSEAVGHVTTRSPRSMHSR